MKTRTLLRSIQHRLFCCWCREVHRVFPECPSFISGLPTIREHTQLFAEVVS